MELIWVQGGGQKINKQVKNCVSDVDKYSGEKKQEKDRKYWAWEISRCSFK